MYVLVWYKATLLSFSILYSTFILFLILNGSPHVIAKSVCVCTITPGDCLCTLEALNLGDDKIVEEKLLTAGELERSIMS